MAQAVSATGRGGVLLGSVAVLLFVAGPLLAHFHIVPARVGFYLFALAALLGVVTLVLGVVAAVRGGAAAGTLGIGAALTAAFLLMALPARKLPPINDITTDTVNPPQFVAAGELAANHGRDMNYPGASFAERQLAAYPDLAPLALEGAPAEVFARVEAAARGMANWEITRSDPDARSLEGVATTALFRFQDDFVIEVRPRDGGSVVHMRSKSRDGRGDIGANAERIRAFYARLRQ